MTVWYDTASSATRAVRVGEAGAIQTNDDPTNNLSPWVVRNSGVTTNLYGVTISGMYFTAVGEAGVILLSIDDGTSWTLQPTPTSENLNDCSAGAPVVMAVGDNGTLIYSQDDGINWDALVSGVSVDLNGITIFNAEYTAVGDDDTILTGEVTTDNPLVTVHDGLFMGGSLPTHNALQNLVTTEVVEMDEGTGRGIKHPDIFEEVALEAINLDAPIVRELAGGVDVQAGEQGELDQVLLETIVMQEPPPQWVMAGDFGEPYFGFSSASMFLSLFGNQVQHNANVESFDVVQFFAHTYGAGDVLTELFTLSSSISGAFGKLVTDDFTMSSLLATTLFAGPDVPEIIALDDTLAAVGTMQLLIEDEIDLTEEPSTLAVLGTVLEDGVVFTSLLVRGSEEFDTWVMNASNRGVTTYENYPFESMAASFDGFFGAAEDGIYLLEGDADETAAIAARLRTGSFDFGTAALKNVDCAYIGIRSDGDLVMKVVTNEGKENWYKVDKVHDNSREKRAQFGRGNKARYWQFELHNVKGSELDLESIELHPISMKRRV